MSTYVFGDLQGCFDELQSLLSLVNFDPSTDELCFVGDLINRGPKSLETIDFLMSLSEKKIVLGNHDLHFLAVATGTQKPSKKDTFHDLLESEKLDTIIHWMRQQPLIIYLEKFDVALVHAGVPPIWSVQNALDFSHEVETILKGDNYISYFENMYGNHPDTWDIDLQSWDRLRVITNYLTRMRYCDEKGKLELSHKTKVEPAGYKPWFSFNRHAFNPNKSENTKILFGHWAAMEGITNQSDILALDTGCVWGRSLTCIRLEDHKYFSVPAKN